MLSISCSTLKVYDFEFMVKSHKTYELSKQGKGIVTAKDIETNADVEIVNPDHVIATIDDDKGKIDC